MAALQAQGVRPIILTAGFVPIVTPLVAELGLRDSTIIGSRGFGLADRRNGKLHRAIESLGADTVHRSLVLTDSGEDHAVAASARPLRTVWPEARFLRALSRVYLPGEYLSQIKRPGERYIFRGILQEDFAFWILSTIGLAAVPALHIAGLACLLVSFWAIYERGYVDNDLSAAAFEEDPKLTAAFHTSVIATPVVQPWIWAFVVGAGGVFLVRWPERPGPFGFRQMARRSGCHACLVQMYNRIDKSTRIWMFPFLQFARSAAPIALVPVLPIGAAALGAQILARWVPYYVYRIGGKDWPKAHTHLIRVLFLIVLGALLAVSAGMSAIVNWTALALLLWSVFRARDEIRTVITAARRLDKEHAAP